VLGFASPASGQVPVHVEVTPQVGYFFFNGDRARDIEVNEDGVLYQMRFGVVLSSHWGLEGSAGLVPSDFGEPDGRGTRSYFVAGAGTYRFANSSVIAPLVSAGAELLDMDTSASGDQTNFALVWGAGLEVKVGRRTALRVDGRHHYFHLADQREPDEPDAWLNHFEIAAGLCWRPWE
jgi:opacity protein-like surface antigen